METYDAYQAYLALVAAVGFATAAILAVVVVGLGKDRRDAAVRGAEALRAWRREGWGIALTLWAAFAALQVFGIGI